MSSNLITRNITVAGRRTSMRLEPEMWDAFDEICRRESKTIHEICTLVSQHKGRSSLTAALRVFVLSYYREAATDNGHTGAGHGLDPNPALSRFDRGKGPNSPN
jgi:predicted DNA-binding ribbon-helix-helix protein